VFRGVIGGIPVMTGPVLVMDLGGGSTEFIVGQGREMIFRESFPLGVVRLSENQRVNDPPGAAAENACLDVIDEFLSGSVEERLKHHLDFGKQAITFVGVGGTATVLAAMEQRLAVFQRELLDGSTLSFKQVSEACHRLWTLPLVDRQKIPGLPPKRADVMIFGAAIYLAVMRRFGFPAVQVSTRGLRYAAILPRHER